MSLLLERFFEIIVIGFLFAIIIGIMTYGFVNSTVEQQQTTNNIWETVEQQNNLYNGGN